MTAIIGQLGLIGAFLLSLASTLPFRRTRSLRNNLLTHEIIFIGLSIALGCLVYAHSISDFSLLNVFLNSHTSKPFLYKISGVWGNHEGSMLLFVWMLGLYTLCFAARTPNTSIKSNAAAIQCLLLTGFLIYLLFASNPFVTISPVPKNGQGLNPLLQDIGLAIHPPMLYLGYVGFSLCFSIAAATLYHGQFTRDTAQMLKPWAMAAWAFLTSGIALGSWWAYRELGWGGFWFWDPVENCSLLPWLCATAFFHSLIVTEKRGLFKNWTLLLAILTFSMSLLGLFLVRSGVLTSVHSFASDPLRGTFILVLMTLYVGGALVLFAIKGPFMRQTAQGNYTVISRESSLLFNNILMITLCVTVLLGTLYPIMLQVISSTSVAVGTPYYLRTFIPIALLIPVVAAISPLLKWKNGNIAAAAKKLMLPFIVTSLLFLALIGIFYLPLLPALGITLALWFFVAALIPFLRQYQSGKGITLSYSAMTLGHASIALLMFFIIIATSFEEERTLAIAPNQSIEFAGYTITSKGIELTIGKNYIAKRGEFSVTRDGKKFSLLYPEVRIYPVEQSQTTESAIARRWLSDLYIVIGGSFTENEGLTPIRLYYRPGINGIWLSALLLAASGVMSLSARRKK